MTSGTMSGRAAHLISSDSMIGPDSAGGPVFSVDGPLVGLTTLLQEETDADARVVPIADLCGLVASADAKLKAGAPPSGTALPVEPARPFPVGALKERATSASATPYRMTSTDFDVAFITPVMVYAVMNPSEEQRRRQASGVARGPGPAPLNPLENFSNWSSYVADVPPVLLIRVTPRLVEGFWTKVARGAASTQGMSLPPIKRFKSGFGRLRAFCGDTEVLPVHPFRLEQRVSETEAIDEGLYAFDPARSLRRAGPSADVLFGESAGNRRLEGRRSESRPADLGRLRAVSGRAAQKRPRSPSALAGRPRGPATDLRSTPVTAGMPEATGSQRTRGPADLGLLSAPHDDVAEALHVEAGAADQRAVDVGLRRSSSRDVVRLDAAAVDHVAAARPRRRRTTARSRARMCACASPACAGVALRPVPIAQTGS